jgi:F-type H+-transporting ATPase subunit d
LCLSEAPNTSYLTEASRSVHLSPPIIANVSSLQRSAALKLDWVKVTTSLGLRGQTVTSLQAFKKRNEDARRRVTQLSEQSSKVDFAHYRSILKNQAVVDEIEKHFNSFKPATYDVGRQIKAIEAFEAQAVKNAEETKGRVDLELEDLEATLKNIEEARPFDELTVVCVTGTAHFTKDAANGCLRLGRSRCCSPRHRREDISTRF